jgi:hypothetical protein
MRSIVISVTQRFDRYHNTMVGAKVTLSTKPQKVQRQHGNNGQYNYEKTNTFSIDGMHRVVCHGSTNVT